MNEFISHVQELFTLDLVEAKDGHEIYKVLLPPVEKESHLSREDLIDIQENIPYLVLIPHLQDGYSAESLERAQEIGQEYGSIKLLSANDLYRAKPVRTSKDLYPLINDWHSLVPEIHYDWVDYLAQQDLVELKFVEEISQNERHSYYLGTIWFKGWPLAIFKYNSDEHEGDLFITDRLAYLAMVQYLLSSVPYGARPHLKEYDPNQAMLELTEFYGDYVRL